MNIAWFVDEVLVKTLERGCFVPMKALWRLFEKVCETEGRKSCSQREFSKKLKELGFRVEPRKMQEEGARKNVWCCLGVKVKEEYEEEYEDIMDEMKIERATRRTKKKKSVGEVRKKSVGEVRKKSVGEIQKRRREPGENNVKWFVDGALKRKRDDFIPFIPLEVLWEFFADDCSALHKRPCSQEGFEKRLKELGFRVGPKLVRVAGKWKKVICCFDVTIDEAYLDDLEDLLMDLGYEREVEWVRKRKRKEWLRNEEGKEED